MPRKSKERKPWTEERRANVAIAWAKRAAEREELERMGKNDKTVKGKFCVYCGEKKDLQEYVPTKRVRRNLPEGHKVKFLLVPTCNECHRLLELNESHTVEERRAYVKSLFRIKYIMFLEWTEIPENDLYRGLRTNYQELLDRMNHAKRRLVKRLDYKV